MAVIIPPWLKAPDLAEDYTRGLQLGTQVAESQARIAAENTRTAMESQARQQTLQQEHLMQQARLATETAYKKTQLQLESDRLAQVAKVNAQKTRDAALALADRQGLYADLASGMDPVQAHLRHPRASSVANVENAQRAALDLGNRNLMLRQQEFAEKQAENEAKRNKRIKIGTRKIYDKGGKLTEERDIYQDDFPEPTKEQSTIAPAPFLGATVPLPVFALNPAGNPVLSSFMNAPGESAPSTKALDRETAMQILRDAGGDKEKARAKARELGYSW